MFSFPPPFFPTHLCIIHFPETVKLSNPGMASWLTVTRALVLGVTRSVECGLLGWCLKSPLGASRSNNFLGLFPHLQKKKSPLMLILSLASVSL